MIEWRGRPPRRVAVVHEWLVNYAGSERVLEQLLLLLPDADLYAVVDFVPPDERGFLGGRRARTTFVQRLPFARTRYRAYLPLMPLAIEQLDLSGYDLVVSSSHAVAKGVLTDPDALHVSYCHSPLRYAWDLQHAYLRETGLGWGPTGLLVRRQLHRLRVWDARAALGVDRFVANSRFVARRIAKAYRRAADVVYPPVDTDAFTPGPPERPAPDGGPPYYVAASRFAPYKRMPMIVEAFRALPDRRLVVIGDGPEWRAAARAAGRNVTLLGRLPSGELRAWLRGARAYLFAAIEDFGIAPIEAQACGTPVVAYAGGALRETLPGLDADAPCGVLYEEQTPGALAAAVREFEAHAGRINARACRANAERYSVAAFRAGMSLALAGAYAEHVGGLRTAR
ncbi:glycosyl transferase family 1 [Gemmatimonadetes bacterium T265]|nr:glycosyl transferase family 1 [Gemmatimonadetes bacterium T265]